MRYVLRSRHKMLKVCCTTDLGEDEHAVVAALQHLEHLGQQVELATRLLQRRDLVHPVPTQRRVLRRQIKLTVKLQKE